MCSVTLVGHHLLVEGCKLPGKFTLVERCADVPQGCGQPVAMRQKAMEMAVADPTWVGVDLGMVMGLRNRHGTGPQGWGRLYSGSHSLTEREIPGEWRYQYGCCCETLLSSGKGKLQWTDGSAVA